MGFFSSAVSSLAVSSANAILNDKSVSENLHKKGVEMINSSGVITSLKQIEGVVWYGVCGIWAGFFLGLISSSISAATLVHVKKTLPKRKLKRLSWPFPVDDGLGFTFLEVISLTEEEMDAEIQQHRRAVLRRGQERGRGVGP